jgi:serine/threonine protein kinase
MPVTLTVLAGPDEGRVFHFADGEKITVGRGFGNVQLNDQAVSRVHCAIETAAGKAVLTDSGSRTGTRVNGKTILEHVLQNDEVVEIGRTRLRFQRTAPKPRPPAPEPEEAPEIQELRKLRGTTLAHFEIGEALGAGTTGVVFRANDVKEGREVALKVYQPAFAKSDEDLQRFIRAVKTMLPMRHQNVVTLYGGGKAGPHCWMAMEYVAGETLEETIGRIGKGGKLDWRPALRMALDVSRGLFYIHGADIIHRSLAPSKVLFSRLGVSKLAGLVRAKALSGELARGVTTAGSLLSDVRFLSPEQVTGAAAVDARSDIYSLGALVYALLTGRPPFDEGSTIQTAAAIVGAEPVPPRETDPNIPAALEHAVLHMLAKKPEDRYQSAAELLAELEQLPKV